jgi:DNA-binding response OmpR family regulator
MDSTLDDTKIICISGMVEPDKIEDLKQSGANDFLQKPFEIETLVERMCRLLDVEPVEA